MHFIGYQLDIDSVLNFSVDSCHWTFLLCSKCSFKSLSTKSRPFQVSFLSDTRKIMLAIVYNGKLRLHWFLFLNASVLIKLKIVYVKMKTLYFNSIIKCGKYYHKIYTHQMCYILVIACALMLCMLYTPKAWRYCALSGYECMHITLR